MAPVLNNCKSAYHQDKRNYNAKGDLSAQAAIKSSGLEATSLHWSHSNFTQGARGVWFVQVV